MPLCNEKLDVSYKAGMATGWATGARRLSSRQRFMSIPIHTRAKIPSETSFTLLQFRCTRRCRRGIGRLMSTRYFVRSCYRVISILIESRFAVSNAECPSRHEKLPYFRSDRNNPVIRDFVWKWNKLLRLCAMLN